MRRGTTAQFMKTGEGYSGPGDFHVLKQYLIPISDNALAQDPQMCESIKHHLEKATKIITREHEKIVSTLSILREQLDHDCHEDYGIPDRNCLNWYDLIILLFLIETLYQINIDSITEKIIILDEQRNLMEQLLDLIQYMHNTNKTVTVRLQRIIESRERSIFFINKASQTRMSLIRRLANKYYTKVQLLPPPFRSNAKNREWLDNIIDSAQRKPETTYFSELPEEIDIQSFFLSPKSPFLNEEGFDNPYNRDNSPNSVKEWIDLATVVLAEYVQTEDEDRAATIAILAMRYLFNSTYPRFYPPHSGNLSHINAVMQRFRKKSPKELGILLKYVPSELQEKPSEMLFQTDTKAVEAVSWMRNAELQLTPIDAAYCVVKAHECLSLMCVTNEFRNKGKESWTNEEFLSKMPGFDDIFEMWRAFLSSCDLGDPRQLLTFIIDFSKLPGFTARILASIAYFEGAVGQLEAEQE